MSDKTETPTPAGIPWGLIFQIIQVILAIITYLAKRETSAAGIAELAPINQEAETALHIAEMLKRARK